VIVDLRGETKRHIKRGRGLSVSANRLKRLRQVDERSELLTYLPFRFKTASSLHPTERRVLK
jgi:hypothetical protein